MSRKKPAEVPMPRPPVEVMRDAEGVPLMANGQRNPTGSGRYCAPRVCYCGSCPWWTPLPPYRVPPEVHRAR